MDRNDFLRCSLIFFLAACLAGCGRGSRPASTPVTPASIALSPANNVSLDIGSTRLFTASALNSQGSPIAVTISFQSTNPAVVTIASSGLACAGSWDSLTNPIVCTPGPAGTAQVTASSNGISSPPVTVYVHQHVDSVKIEPVTPPLPSCLSKDATFDFAARAFSRGIDITSTVGPFSWQAVSIQVVTVDNTIAGLALNQAQATAKVPGTTQIAASVAGANSEPMDFTTCLVQSISLTVEGSGNSFTIASGSKTVTPTIVDSLGTTITGVPLTWSSSEPAIASVSNTGVATAAQAGGATIIGSCTPPGCNLGVAPTLPIYPEGVINATVTGNTKTTTAWVTSTGCQDQTGCVSTIVPVSVPDNTVSSGTDLPFTPNSLVFSRQGTAAFLGSSHGLMLLNLASSPPAVTQVNGVTGKVLAVSPDGKKVVVSDTSRNPNLVFVFDTNTNSTTTFTITGATAADFSPDNLKAYIVAGSKLYVYSALDALDMIDLAAPANDVSFLPVGAFAYLAGGSPSAVTVRTTCTNEIATDSGNVPQILPTPATPAFIRSVPNATQVLAVDSPGIDVIDVTTTPQGCPPTVSDTVQSVNLGQGSFVPTQFLVASDSSRAFLLTRNLASVLAYNVASRTSSPIQLADSAAPIQASLTPDGTLLYVAASDGSVHVLNPAFGQDIAQISFPTNLCSNVDFTCKPDLIAIRP